jgi:hypothetical protein
LAGGSTVTGLQYTFTAKKSGAASATEFAGITNPVTLKVGGNAGNPTANNLSATALTTSSATYSTGSSTDLWGVGSSLTVANVNSATENTGPTVGAFFDNAGGTTGTAQVDAVQQTVFYTAGGASGANQAMMTLGCG